MIAVNVQVVFAAFIWFVVVKADLAPSIVWDPRNPFFDCSAKDGPEVNVQIGDSLNIVCPHRAVNPAMTNGIVANGLLYESASLLQPKDALKNYNACDATGARRVLTCDDPANFKFINLPIRQFSGSSQAILFYPGRTYYLIGTSGHTKNTIDQTKGGCCLPPTETGMYSLKLKIYVCTAQEVADGKCNRCKDSSCYRKGCGTFTAWEETMRVKDLTKFKPNWDKNMSLATLDSDCLSVSKRKCNGDSFTCSGITEKYEKLTCPSIRPAFECYQWDLGNEIYWNGSHCFSKKTRWCKVGLFTKMKFLQEELYDVSCLTTTAPPPTTVQRPSRVCTDWVVIHSYAVGNVCIEILNRTCRWNQLDMDFNEGSMISYKCSNSTTSPPTSLPLTTVPTTGVLPTTDPFYPWSQWTDCVNNLRTKTRMCKHPVVYRKMKYCSGVTQFQTTCNTYPGAGSSASTAGERSGTDLSSLSYMLVAAAFVIGILIGIGAMILCRRALGEKTTSEPMKKENSFEFNNVGFELESPLNESEFPDPPVIANHLTVDDNADRLSINHNFGRGINERTPSSASVVELKGFTPRTSGHDVMYQ